MPIKIKLTADANGNGVDFNQFLTDHFSGFEPFQFPLFLPEDGPETTQIVHLDTPETGSEADTRVVLLEGSDFFYTFSNHSVSGTIDQIRLGSLGPAWDETEQDIVYTDDLVGEINESVRLFNLDIFNELGERQEVHEIVRGMMGGGLDGTLADPTPILDQIWGQNHSMVGSTGDDTWTGTDFNDAGKGGLGNDTLDGADGADALKGQAGDDTLYGGAKADRLWGNDGRDTLDGGSGSDRLWGGDARDILRGGAGADTLRGENGNDLLIGGGNKDTQFGGAGRDTFRFVTASDADGDLIRDFSQSEGDVLDLSKMDADTTIGGNQSFTFIGTSAFSGTAGELMIRTGANTFVRGDLDGDGQYDFSIRLSGSIALDASDFLL